MKDASCNAARNANYLERVKLREPKTKHFKNCAAAFGVGGLPDCQPSERVRRHAREYEKFFANM